jgi:hypothetical protein
VQKLVIYKKVDPDGNFDREHECLIEGGHEAHCVTTHSAKGFGTNNLNFILEIKSGKDNRSDARQT